MAYNEDSSASGHDEPWIQWFCGLKGHEMFCEVERSYIEDGFNLYGLRACVSNFSDCLDLILDRIGPDDSDDSHLTQSACTLYGLIHARYIITAHGLDAMYNKYAAKEFGTCPLIQCNAQPVLPVGLRDEMGADTVKIYCPRCQCVYHPPPVRSRSSHHGPGTAAGSGAVDGAAFGTTFPHLFLMTFNNLVPDPLDSKSTYVPRVFGFRVHQSSRTRNSATGAVGGGAGGFAVGGPPAFSSTTVPQGNVGRREHGSSHHQQAPSASRGGSRGAAGPSSPPVEVGLPAVPADGGGPAQQNGKAGGQDVGGGKGPEKLTEGRTGLAGGAGGSRGSASSGGKRAGGKGGGGNGISKGGDGRSRSSGPGASGQGADKRKAKDVLLDGVKGTAGGLGDNEGNSFGKAKKQKQTAAGAT